MRRPSRTRPLVGLAAAVLLVPLAGCGEKEEPATTGPVVAQSTSPIDGSTTTSTPAMTDEQLATSAARDFLTSTDAAAVCDDGITPGLLEQAYGDREGCLAARKPQALASTATVSQVDVRAKSAAVTVRASGGSYGNGETLHLTVIGDAAGTWRVSKVR